MNSVVERGFTLVEVMIFLAISGLLLFALLNGTGTIINRQRHTDSVRSTQSFFQNQFEATLSVKNSHEQLLCNDKGIKAGTELLGASKACYILGRAIEIVPNSPTLNAYPVVGVEPETFDPTKPDSSDAETIRSFEPRRVEKDEFKTEFTVPWEGQITGTKRVEGGGGKPVRWLYLLRSPQSGSLVVFSSENSGNGNDSLKNDLKDDTVGKVSNICIGSQDIASARALIEINGEVGGLDAVDARFEVPAADC